MTGSAGGSPAYAVAFDPEGALLAVRYRGHTEIWRTSSGERSCRLDSEGVVRRVLAFLPGGRYLAVAPFSGESLRFLDTRTGKLEGHRLGWRKLLIDLDVNTDGTLLALAAESVVHVREPWKDEAPFQPLAHPDEVVAVDFGPYSEWLATATRAEVRLWYLGRPACPSLALPTGGAFLKDLDFSADGRLLAVATDEGVLLWPIPAPPDDLREMQLRTWLQLGLRRSDAGIDESIAPDEWRRYRKELDLLKKEEAR